MPHSKLSLKVSLSGRAPCSATPFIQTPVCPKSLLYLTEEKYNTRKKKEHNWTAHNTQKNHKASQQIKRESFRLANTYQPRRICDLETNRAIAPCKQNNNSAVKWQQSWWAELGMPFISMHVGQAENAKGNISIFNTYYYLQEEPDNHHCSLSFVIALDFSQPTVLSATPSC